jgi:hypothetical protein
MYCYSCGVAVAKGLSFCSYCGAKLPSSDTALEFREVKPGLIVSAMAGVFVLGLPGIAFIIFMLNAALRLDPQQTMAFAWTVLILLVALELVFLFLLMRRKPRNEAAQQSLSKGSDTRELESKHGGALPEPVASVTEHTTRAFDPIPRERI